MAMTCGKPVLLSNIGPHNETVQNSNADLVYHSGDLQDFGRKMRILYQEKDTFESISINYSKDHSWQKKAEILSKLYYDKFYFL